MQDVQDLLIKTEKRFAKMKHIDARDFVLQTFFPLMKRLVASHEGDMENVNGNFEDIFVTLGIVDETSFFDLSEQLVTGMGNFIDEMVIKIGYAERLGDGSLKFLDTLPEETAAKLALIHQLNGEWGNQFVAARKNAEDRYADEFDDDDDDDDDDFDEGELLTAAGDDAEVPPGDDPEVDPEVEPEKLPDVDPPKTEAKSEEEAANV